MLAEAVERLVGDAFDRGSKNDEADVAVFGVCAGIRGQRSGESCGKKFAQGDGVAAGILSGEFGGYGYDRHVEVEKATFVQDHRHARGGDDFGEGSKIKNAESRYLRRIGFVGEAAERLQCHKVTLIGDGDRSGSKSMLGDGLAQPVEGTGEYFILLLILRSGKM